MASLQDNTKLNPGTYFEADGRWSIFSPFFSRIRGSVRLVYKSLVLICTADLFEREKYYTISDKLAYNARGREPNVVPRN